MNKKCLFLYLLVCLLVVGCVTLKEPDNENQSIRQKNRFYRRINN